ncbi:ferrous iron transport protein A [Micromonospora olivasterospora]|uniref:Ferrous iron transport protein A n=1 Tax=Micromonospora olivasterospora TaxID=1880 RepID=A0A562I984_MICOL|nr:FeoA family protein [Micromonospora olivasterospora]TWH67233.1 ferrous iron transport protein A [Micromonospora olivasterospora]
MRTPALAQPEAVVSDAAASTGSAGRLSDLPPGSGATIVGLADGAPPSTAHRLADLGFTAGTLVQVVRRAPLRDPVVYRVKDYDLCLRRAQAAHVLIRDAR